jgi:hypothetical protein
MLTVRVVEYDVVKADGTISELFCVLTTLTDQQRYSKQDIAGLYSQRWSAAETTIGENKSTITDAGPSRGPILRSESPDLILQEIWARLADTQLLRRAAHTAAVAGNVTTDEISFTTVRREAIRSMTQSQITATTPAATRTGATGRAHRHILANRVITGRDRHSPRRQKWRPRFPHTATQNRPAADRSHSAGTWLLSLGYRVVRGAAVPGPSSRRYRGRRSRCRRVRRRARGWSVCRCLAARRGWARRHRRS